MVDAEGERRRLEAVFETGLLDQAPLAPLDRAARIVRRALDAKIALVSLIDDTRQFFTSSDGIESVWGPIRQTALSHSMCADVVHDKAPLVVTNTADDDRFRDHPARHDLGVVAYAGVPIVASDGHVLGAVCAIDRRPREWTDRDLAVLGDTVQWVAEEMDLLRQLQRARASERHLTQLHEALRQTRAQHRSSAVATLHDLRTPLTALGIGLDQLDQVVKEPSVTRIVAMLSRNVDYIGSLVDEASEELGLKPVRVVDAAKVATEVVDHVTVPESVELELDLPEARPAPVRFGPVLLRRCFVNLADNALRFATTRVRLWQRREGDDVVTRIDDDGPGLPSTSDYARIGEPHLRLHPGDGRSRNGLGLSIAQRLLSDRGGVLRGEPSPLGGARFEIRLPCAV